MVLPPEIVDTGAEPNNGQGDPLNIAFTKINNNFANLVGLTSSSSLGELILAEDSNTQGTTTVNVDATSPVSVTNNYFINNISTTTASTSQPTYVNVGVLPNDGTGDPLRTAFQKINDNFLNLYANIIPLTETITAQNLLVSSPCTTPMLTFLEAIGPFGNQEYINVGTMPNDGTGDPLRTAFEKINNNFSNLFSTATTTYTVYTTGSEPDQVILALPTNKFTRGTFQIRSSDTGTPDSQDVTISSQLTNNGLDVKFTAYGTTFAGTPLLRYDMDVFNANVRLMVDPLADRVLLHFITAEVTYIGDVVPGFPLGLDGYVDAVIATEDDFVLTTEAYI